MPDLVVYKKLALTGGGATALDGIDGADLVGNELAFVTLTNQIYHYILNATSGATDDGLTCIAPDVNPGNKRWILQHEQTVGPMVNLLPNTQRKAMSGCTLENEGADLAVNGSFTSGDVSWTKSATWTIVDQGGGDYEAVATAAQVDDIIYQIYASHVIGKLYKIVATVTNYTDGSAQLYAGASVEGDVGNILTGTGTLTAVFEATATSGSIGVRAKTINSDFRIDDITLYEQKRAYTAADTLGPDGTTKTTTLDWHIMEQDATHGKGYYIDKYTKGANGAEYANLLSITNRADLDAFKGQPVTFGMAGYSVTATDNLKIQIYDGVGTTESAFWGADSLDWKEITRTVSASATELTFRVLLDGDTSDVAYGSFWIAVNGSSIGQWNYAPKAGEVIWFNKIVSSTKFTGSANSTANALLNLESDSNGQIGKGIKGIRVMTAVNDSGSDSITRSEFLLGGDSDFHGYYHSCTGLVNDAVSRKDGQSACDNNGDVYYYTFATGSLTLDVTVVYQGIEP